MKNILVLQKPGAADRIGQIETFLAANTQVIRTRQVLVDAWRIEAHYGDFISKPFFPELMKYFIGEVVQVWEVRVPDIERFRKLLGSFDHELMGGEAAERTPGGDRIAEIEAQCGMLDNGLHASESAESGAKEIKLWFDAPSLAKGIYSPEVDAMLESIHRQIYDRLSQIPGCFVQFAAASYNGRAIPENAIQIEYRMLCPDDRIAEIARSADVPGTIQEKNEADPESEATYIKYEMSFQGGKANVTFVPLSKYRPKFCAIHMNCLLPGGYPIQQSKRPAPPRPIQPRPTQYPKNKKWFYVTTANGKKQIISANFALVIARF